MVPPRAAQLGSEDCTRTPDRAYRNLRSGLARVHTTLWMFPFYSSRWKDVFTYAQVKTEYKLELASRSSVFVDPFFRRYARNFHDPDLADAAGSLGKCRDPRQSACPCSLGAA